MRTARPIAAPRALPRLRPALAAAVLLAAAAQPAGHALAQESGSGSGSGASLPALPDTVSKAAQALRDAGENALLVRDLLGSEVTQPDGSPAGTIENFAVVPGGRIVAAILETPDGTRLPVPFAAVKLASRADDAPVRLSQSLEALRDAPGLDALADALPGDGE